MILLPAIAIWACATASAAPAPSVAPAAQAPQDGAVDNGGIPADLIVEGPPRDIFDYTPEFRDKAVPGLLQKVMGECWRNYDTDLPLIAWRPDGKIGINFSFDLDSGTCPDYLNPPTVTIVIDPQTKQPVDVLKAMP